MKLTGKIAFLAWVNLALMNWALLFGFVAFGIPSAGSLLFWLGVALIAPAVGASRAAYASRMAAASRGSVEPSHNGQAQTARKGWQ